MRVAQLESESRREKEVRRKLPALLSCAPFTPEALQERLADRADTSGLPLLHCSHSVRRHTDSSTPQQRARTMAPTCFIPLAVQWIGGRTPRYDPLS